MSARRRRIAGILVGAFAAAVLALVLGTSAWGESRNRPGSVLAEAIDHTCIHAAPGASACTRCFELEREYAVVKDIRGQEQLLLIARRDVAGIESPMLLDAWAFNYWAAAWNAKRFMPAMTDDDLSLAINSQRARGIDRLHIHIDRVAPQLKQRLHEIEATLGSGWTLPKQPLPPKGHLWWVRKLPMDDVFSKNLFSLLPLSEPGADPSLGSYALAVVGGATLDGGKPGVFLLAGQDRDLGGAAWGEEVQQDHEKRCAP